MKWTTANRDWEADIVAGRSLLPGPPLFPEEAKAAGEYMGQLRIVDAPGSPTIAEACDPWVTDWAEYVFGSYNPDSGERLIREYFLMIPKKASKSTIAAAIMLTCLLRNWRQSAELLILAPTVEVANNAFDPARDMIRADPALAETLHVQEHIRTITHITTGAKLKVVAADSNTVGGKKASFVLIDELHLFGSQAKAENMLREATGGLAARPEGFVMYLTTQSDAPPAGVFAQKLKYARGVRDGKIDDPAFCPVIYEFPQHMIESGAARDPANFGIVNPNLGRSVSREFLERQYRVAQESGEGSVRGFLSKFLNVEIGMTLRADRWAGADHWETQGDTTLTLESLIERSEVITVGIDGGGLDDLLGLAVVGRCAETREWLAWCHAWAHPSVLERRKEIAPLMHDFAAQGHLTLVQRIGDDADQVADIVDQINCAGLLDKCGLDPHGIGAILDALIEREIDQEAVVGISQGWKLSGAIKTTERKLAEGGMTHAGQPMMAWSAGNARVEPRGNAIVITKQASGTAKIDPLMALFNAVSLMSLNPPAKSGKHQMFFL